MAGQLGEMLPDARIEAEALYEAIVSAEQIIVSAIERECEALRTGRLLAARALHTRLCDAARMYLDTTRAAQASIDILEDCAPGICERLEERRENFASLLKVELAILATERAALFGDGEASLDIAPQGTRIPKNAGARLVAIDGGARRSRRRAG